MIVALFLAVLLSRVGKIAGFFRVVFFLPTMTPAVAVGVLYLLLFNGDFGLHDAPWQTMPFGSAHWRTQGSHGCGHVPTPTMAWLYHWARVGSTVVTIEH